MRASYRSLAGLLILSVWQFAPENAAMEDLKEGLPEPVEIEVDFQRDILPIFERSCFRCHGPERPRSGFRLDQPEAALRGGDHGVAILPGKSVESPLIHYVAGLVSGMEMPPEGVLEPLSDEEVALLMGWIDQGAVWGEREVARRRLYSVSPGVRWIGVKGNERQFREHAWMREGWAGGMEDFRLHQELGSGDMVTLSGRLFLREEDYRVALEWKRPEGWYVRGGYEQWQRHWNDAGGFYPPLGPMVFRLERDLVTERGRAWVEGGLARPGLPDLRVGYEYHYREGEHLTLNWSSVFDGAGMSAAIYPSWRQLSEEEHRVHLELSHEFSGVLIENRFQGEFYNLNSERFALSPFQAGEGMADSGVRFVEDYDQFQAANSFRIEKQPRPWLLFSGGHLYSQMDGESAFRLEGFVPSDLTAILFIGEEVEPVFLRRRTHMINANTLLGPWKGLSLAAGIQTDWTRERGLGEGFVPVAPGAPGRLFASNRDKLRVEELVSLRYTGIPWTVLFAEGRFQQEEIDHFESQALGGSEDPQFLRETDARSDLKQYRAGVSVSPVDWLQVHSSWRRRVRQNDYDHLMDRTAGLPEGNGYPGFIRERDIRGDEFEARLSLKGAWWFRANLKYQFIETDYRTVTDPSLVSAFDPETFLPVQLALPGGGLLAGRYQAHNYSLGLTLTPWRRVYLAPSVNYRATRMRTGVEGILAPPYHGNAWQFNGSASVVLNEKTDWMSNYTYSRADYSGNNEAPALVLGLEYERHGLITGFTRRFTPTMTGTLQYGFFKHREPVSAGVNDYTAHAVFVRMALLLN